MPEFDRFTTLVDEIQVVIESMNRKLEKRFPTIPNGEEKKRLLRELDGELNEAQRLVREMQLEADSDLQASSGYRQQLNSQIREFRSQVEQIKSLSSKIKNDEQSRREGNYSANPFFQEDPQQAANRSRLLQGRAVLERTSDSLGRSLAVAAESERVGVDVVTELHTQRESLENTRNRLEETNEDLAKSRKIIRSMGRRIVTNKIFLFIIVFLEVAILAGVVYWKFFSKK